MLGQLGLMKEVAKFLSKQFKLDKMEKIISYVEGDNELDIKVKHIEIKVKHIEEKLKLLLKMAHFPRDFKICDDCKCKIVITENIEERKI